MSPSESRLLPSARCSAMTHVVCVGLATRDTLLKVPVTRRPTRLVLATDAAVAGGGVLLRRPPSRWPGWVARVLRRLGRRRRRPGVFIRDGLAAEGVDVSELAVLPGRRSPQSAVYIASGTQRSRRFQRRRSPRLSLARAAVPQADWVHVDWTGCPRSRRDPAIDRRRHSWSTSTSPESRSTRRRRPASSTTSAAPRRRSPPALSS